MRTILYSCTLLLLIVSCEEATDKESSVGEPSSVLSESQQLIQKSIAAHGGPLYENSLVTFRFRGRQYEAARRAGKFEYKRIFNDSLERYVEDVLNNQGFYRKIEGERVELLPDKSKAYANSVNSVIYFALLPYFLKDPAVQSDYLGKERIQGQDYEKLKVTFQQERGGKDFEDEFVYWLHQDSMTIHYLAYNYLTDGGGARFRSAYNVRREEGMRFADYINWKPKAKERRDVENFGKLFEAGELEELSKIETENIKVTLLK